MQALACMWEMSLCFVDPDGDVPELNRQRLRNINKLRLDTGVAACDDTDFRFEDPRRDQRTGRKTSDAARVLVSYVYLLPALRMLNINKSLHKW